MPVTLSTTDAASAGTEPGRLTGITVPAAIAPLRPPSPERVSTIRWGVASAT
jgi:hypothetical protein